MLNFHQGILLKGDTPVIVVIPSTKGFQQWNLGDGSPSVVVVLRVQGQIPIHDMPGTALVTHEVPASS